jgi:hypothetical protein
VTIRRSGWEMTEGRAVNPLLISCSVTAVVSYVALVYLVTMERLEDPGLWTLGAVERLYDFANLLSDPPRASNAYRTSCLRMSSWSARPSRLARFRVGSLDSVQAIPFSGVTNPRYRSRRGREGGTPRSVELRRPPRLRYRLKNIEIQKQILSPRLLALENLKIEIEKLQKRLYYGIAMRRQKGALSSQTSERCSSA